MHFFSELLRYLDAIFCIKYLVLNFTKKWNLLAFLQMQNVKYKPLFNVDSNSYRNIVQKKNVSFLEIFLKGLR